MMNSSAESEPGGEIFQRKLPFPPRPWPFVDRHLQLPKAGQNARPLSVNGRPTLFTPRSPLLRVGGKGREERIREANRGGRDGFSGCLPFFFILAFRDRTRSAARKGRWDPSVPDFAR